MRQDPARWAKLVVLLGLACLGWLGLAVLWMVHSLWPAPTTAAVLAAALGVTTGLLIQQRRYAEERLRLDDLERRQDAYRLADTRTDLDEIGPVTSPVADDTGPGTIAHLRPYDQDAELPVLYRERLT